MNKNVADDLAICSLPFEKNSNKHFVISTPIFFN